MLWVYLKHFTRKNFEGRDKRGKTEPGITKKTFSKKRSRRSPRKALKCHRGLYRESVIGGKEKDKKQDQILSSVNLRKRNLKRKTADIGGREKKAVVRGRGKTSLGHCGKGGNGVKTGGKRGLSYIEETTGRNMNCRKFPGQHTVYKLTGKGVRGDQGGRRRTEKGGELRLREKGNPTFQGRTTSRKNALSQLVKGPVRSREWVLNGKRPDSLGKGKTSLLEKKKRNDGWREVNDQRGKEGKNYLNRVGTAIFHGSGWKRVIAGMRHDFSQFFLIKKRGGGGGPQPARKGGTRLAVDKRGVLQSGWSTKEGESSHPRFEGKSRHPQDPSKTCRN